MSEVAIELVERFPGVADYRRLRAATGLSAKSEPAALRGLANTTHGVSLLRDGEVVGMIVKMPGHPQWMAVVGLLLPIPAALAGAWLAGKGRRTA